MNQINEYNETIFERNKHTNEYDKEYWYARELQVVLEYKRWDKFCNVIENAKKQFLEHGFIQLEERVIIV